MSTICCDILTADIFFSLSLELPSWLFLLSVPQVRKTRVKSVLAVMHPPVEENIWQWRVCAHVRHPLMHNDHDKGSESKHEHHIDGAQHCLPVLWIQAPRLLLVLPISVLVILLSHWCCVSAIAVSAWVSITQPVQTASGACGRVAIKGETQLLQHAYVLFLEFADGHH